MTVALEGHADVNSTDRCTRPGTSVLEIVSNPKRGKNVSAVVVNR